MGEIGSEALVQHIDNAGQRNVLVLDATCPYVAWAFEASSLAGFQYDASFMDLLQAVVFQLYVIVEIEAATTQPLRELGWRKRI